VKKNSFGLLEVEMADLEHFWRKTLLGPLGVKKTFALETIFSCTHESWQNLFSKKLSIF
jgi:hypothetical protein